MTCKSIGVTPCLPDLRCERYGDRVDCGLEGFERFGLGTLIAAAVMWDRPCPPDTLIKRYREQMRALSTLHAWEKGTAESEGRPACAVPPARVPLGSPDTEEPVETDGPFCALVRNTSGELRPARLVSRRLRLWELSANRCGDRVPDWDNTEHNLANRVAIPWAEQTPLEIHGERWSVEQALEVGWRVRRLVKRWNERLNGLWRETARRKWLEEEWLWPLDVAFIALDAASMDEFLDLVDQHYARAEARIYTAYKCTNTPGADLFTSIKSGSLSLTCNWNGTPKRIEGVEDAWALNGFQIYNPGHRNELYAAQYDHDATMSDLKRERPGGIRLTLLRLDRDQILQRCRWWPGDDNGPKGPEVNTTQAKHGQTDSSSQAERSDLLHRSPALRNVRQL